MCVYVAVPRSEPSHWPCQKHLREKEMEAQRDDVIYTVSHSIQMANGVCEPGSGLFDSKPTIPVLTMFVLLL